MKNLYTQWYDMYVKQCKEQKVDEKDIRFKFEEGESYLDTNYGVLVRKREGKRVLVDWWYVEDDTIQKGEQRSWEWVFVDGDTELIDTNYGKGAFVSAKCVMK